MEKKAKYVSAERCSKHNTHVDNWHLMCPKCVDEMSGDTNKVTKIFDALLEERAFQDGKWGTIEENPHTIGEWLLIMQKELTEAIDAYFQRPANRLMLDEIRQVAAVAIACMEQHGFVERLEKNQTEWYCETCQMTGTVTIEDNIDFEQSHIKEQLIVVSHGQSSPLCFSQAMTLRIRNG